MSELNEEVEILSSRNPSDQHLVRRISGVINSLTNSNSTISDVPLPSPSGDWEVQGPSPQLLTNDKPLIFTLLYLSSRVGAGYSMVRKFNLTVYRNAVIPIQNVLTEWILP
jgi:hypothetical protein